MGEKKTRVKVTPELIEKINELYAKNCNMAATAKELGISSSTVKKYLNDDNLKKKDAESDDFDALWYYIIRLFGPFEEDEPVSKWNITQIKKFRKDGISYRAQLLTLKYFYEVRKNTTEKSNGSIGIIPYVLDDSRRYYESMERKQKEILESIQKQLEVDRVEIKYNPKDYVGKNKKKKLINLDELGEDKN